MIALNPSPDTNDLDPSLKVPDMADHHVELPSRRSTSSPSPNNAALGHRSSFADNLRHSPRSQRHPSFTQSAVQELLNHPSKTGDSRFVGRDWRNIKVGELAQRSDVRWAEFDTPIEQATKVRRSVFISVARL